MVGQEGLEPTKLSSYELLALPIELLSQRGGFNHVTTPAEYIAFDLRTLRNATYSISGYNQSVLTSCPLVSILKDCPFKFTLRQLGHQLTRPLSQVIHSPTHVVTRPSLHEELPRRSLFAQFRSKRYECIASTVELRHPIYQRATPRR